MLLFTIFLPCSMQNFNNQLETFDLVIFITSYNKFNQYYSFNITLSLEIADIMRKFLCNYET